jgi:Carbohydrate binding domain
MRPLGWTSGDAARRPILPGLVRYDEVAAGEIDHVIRFTAPRTASAYVWPSSHKAGTGVSSDPPMGAWFRLKAGYDISRFSSSNQVILRALKKHGMVLTDNCAAIFMSGAPDPGWNDSDLNTLKTIPGSPLEVVDVSSLKVSSTSYAVAGAPPPPPTELVSNTGFEASLGGWSSGNSRTTLARTCSAAHSGSCSAELGRTKSAGDALLDDSPDSVASSIAGATYTASAWVLAPAGRTVRLRVRELNGASVVRSSVATMTADGSWRRLIMTTAARTGGTRLSLEIIASLAKGSKAPVDDVSLQPASRAERRTAAIRIRAARRTWCPFVVPPFVLGATTLDTRRNS